MADPAAQLVSLALELATLGADLYQLLDIDLSERSSPSQVTDNDISRAWRRIGLKYHPDRVGDDVAKKEKYERCRQARDILLEPAARKAYDATREAEFRKRKEREIMERGRREMVEDLERREKEAATAAATSSRAVPVHGFETIAKQTQRTAEEDEKLRRAFARGRAMEKQRKERINEAERREQELQDKATKKSLQDLDQEEEALQRRLEELRRKKTERKKEKGKKHRDGASSQHDREKQKQQQREKMRNTKTTFIPPPRPESFDPNRIYTLDNFEETLEKLRLMQEEKKNKGKTFPITEDKPFLFPDGRKIRVPRYAFSYKKAVDTMIQEDSSDGREEEKEKYSEQSGVGDSDMVGV